MREPITRARCHGSRARHGVLLLTLFVACFDPHPHLGAPCDTDQQCPSGQRCVGGSCGGTEEPRDDAAIDGAAGDTTTPDAVVAVVPSCVGLPTICGANQHGDCCASSIVPGGAFLRSFDVAADGMSGGTGDPAIVSTFRLDRYEVTVGRFRMFIAAGQGTRASPPLAGQGNHPQIAGSGWKTAWNTKLVVDTEALIDALTCNAALATWTSTPAGNENRPMNCITWYEAMAFCAWDGGFLPTEAEWNYAAAGGSEQRAYPWSVPPTFAGIDSTRASYYVDDTRQCFGDGMNGCAITDLVRVGSKPPGSSRWGQDDMAGNVWEWALDSYAASYPHPCVDCANLPEATYRVLRGGGFDSQTSMRTATRGQYLPALRAADVGVRCARSP